MKYNKDIYEKAEQELQSRRFTARDTQKKHLEEIKNNYPHIYELYIKTKNALAYAFACIGQAEKSSDWKQQREQNKQNLQQALAEVGYPADYLDIKYHCPKCEDNGYKESYMCDCMKELLNLHLSQEINEKSSIQLRDFKDFNPNFYSCLKENPRKLGLTVRECMVEIFEKCKEYAEKIATQNTPESLILSGNTGLGKTFLSSCIAKRILESGKSVIFNSCENILEPIENEHFGKSENTGYINDVINCDLLIIDDLGVEFKTSFSQSVIYNIINSRINKGKPTVISTNFTPQMIQSEYGGRIYSRLKGEYRCFEFVGDDIRTIKKNVEKR